MANPIIVDFLQSIINETEDYDRILIFADWLEEHGDFRVADLRRLVQNYIDQPTYFKLARPSIIALTFFMTFEWHKDFYQHYIRKVDQPWNYKIVRFPVEEADYKNAYLDVCSVRPEFLSNPSHPSNTTANVPS